MNTLSIHEIASRNILAYLEEGRLIQNAWHRTADGKEMACLLGAAAGVSKASDCPAELMPLWLAETTPVLYDKVAKSDALEISRRYGQLIGEWAVISSNGWNRVLARYLLRLIDQALDVVPEIAKNQSYWPAIEKSASDCKQAISTHDKDAAPAAADAARAAARAACAAADAVAYAADAAARAAYAAADAAAYAAYAAEGADAAYAAEGADAAKSLFSALLGEIEREISAA